MSVCFSGRGGRFPGNQTLTQAEALLIVFDEISALLADVEVWQVLIGKVAPCSVGGASSPDLGWKPLLQNGVSG